MNASGPEKPASFFRSWLILSGAFLFVLGCGPLLIIILAAQLGLAGDPNPNPLGPGMLAGITLWPSVLLVLGGILRVNKQKTRARAGQATEESAQ